MHKFVNDEDSAADIFGSDAEDAVDAKAQAQGVTVRPEESPLYLVQVVFEVEVPPIADVALESDSVAQRDDFRLIPQEFGEEIGFSGAFARGQD